MSAFLAVLGMFLLSLFVALLAALQLADYFSAGEEFVVILVTLPAFVAISMLAFVVANLAARKARLFNWVALLLTLLALTPLALPALVKVAAMRSTNPFNMGTENIAIVLEFIVPALLAILVQWGLMRRRWLRTRGDDDLTRWPWVSTIVAGLVILNPFGLDVLGQAIASRQTAWLRDLFRTIALGGAGALIAMTLIEYYIRRRMLRRRSAANA
jgi:hypothetical protein